MSYFVCNSITKNYDNIPVVKDINLSLEKGERGCLLGPSGVGKTTLMSVLSGVDKPDAGSVILDGDNVTGQPGRVSYMLQKDLLLPYKTIVDNVSLPLVLRGISKKQARVQAASKFEFFGLAGYERKYPHQLSGGMRQRAALLRTYLIGSNVLLLDEPFSALDAITKRQMHTWYLDIVSRLGLTTLLITHDIDEALILSDTIYIMSGVPGHIVQSIKVNAPLPRSTDFAISEEFISIKKTIIKAIEA